MRRIVYGCLMAVVALALAVPARAQGTTAFAKITKDNAAQLSQIAYLGRSIGWDIAWAPDGQTIALATTAGIWLYDAAALGDPKVMPRFLEGHTNAVEIVAFNSDGTSLASASADGLWIWDVKSGKVVTKMQGTKGAPSALAYSPDGKQIAISGSVDNTLSIWDSASGQKIATWQNSNQTV